MYRYLFIPHYRLFSFVAARFSSNQLKNFERKTFDYFYTRRLKFFNGNQQQMSNHLHSQLQSLLRTSAINNQLIHLNSTKDFTENLSIEQLNDLLFFAYEHQIKLDLLTKRLIECVDPTHTQPSPHLFIELVNLLVLHQQKYYDYETKVPNKTLENFLQTFELNLTIEQIKTFSVQQCIVYKCL